MMAPQPPQDPARSLLLELLGIPRLSDDACRSGAADIDWNHLLAAAGGSLHPMLAYRLAERGVDVPAPIQHELARARRASAAMVVQRRAAFRRVADALDQAAVPFVVLKGFSLAERVYPSTETRVMGDMDFWVGGQSLRAAMVALEPLGWRMPWWRQTHARFSPDGDELGLRLGSTALILELHRHPRSLRDVIPGALDDIWSRRIRADLGGVCACVLPWEESIIHLSLHLAEHHRFVAALPRLLDVTLIVSTAGTAIDWASLVGRCRTLGIAGWVATTLGTARAMLGAPIPKATLDAFQVPELERLCALASEQVWPGDRHALESLFTPPSLSRWAGSIRWRLRSLVAGEAGSDRSRLRAAGRLLRRIRVEAQLNLPASLRALWRGTLRGEAGGRLRRLSSENQVLLDAMRGRSPGADR